MSKNKVIIKIWICPKLWPFIQSYSKDTLTYWGRVTHICINNLTIIGSDNGLSTGRRLAIIWTDAGILLIRRLDANFNEILIEIVAFSFNKMRFKVSSVKWQPFCLGLNVLIVSITPKCINACSTMPGHASDKPTDCPKIDILPDLNQGVGEHLDCPGWVCKSPNALIYDVPEVLDGVQIRRMCWPVNCVSALIL